jgi:hypothetical protein
MGLPSGNKKSVEFQFSSPIVKADHPTFLTSERFFAIEKESCFPLLPDSIWLNYLNVVELHCILF